MYCCFDGAPIDSEEEFDELRKMPVMERVAYINHKKEANHERS